MTSKSSPTLLRLIIDFATPLSSVALMVFGSAFYTTFLSVHLDGEGYTRGQIGFVQSAFFLGMLVGAFQMEKVIKRVGHIQALAVFGSLATCSTLIQAMYQTFPAWILLRFTFGLCLAALYIVVESWMLYHSTIKTRGVILSLYMICLYASQSISQFVLSFVDIDSFTPFLVSALFTSLSVIPVGLSTNRIPISPTHEAIGFLEIIKISPFGVSGCFISGLILSAIYSFYPIFSVSREIPSQYLMAVTIAGGTLLQWPIGMFSDYFERRKTMLATVFIALFISFLGFAFKESQPFTIFLTSFFIGGFLFTLYPLSITQVCDHLDHSQITTATALLLVAYGFGSVTGPVISSSVVGSFGISALFLYIAALLSALGIVGLYTTLRRPIIPMDEQMDFTLLPNVTPVAFEMDPRGENDD